MTPPILPVKPPTVLIGQPNGELDRNLLAPVDSLVLGRLMLDKVATAMRALHAFALTFGIRLASTGRYRPLQQQYDLFIARYRPCSYAEYLYAKAFKRAKLWTPAARADVATRLNVTIPDSTHWCKIQRPNGTYPASAAVPGTSNHGDAIADDIAELVNGQLVSLRATTIDWLYTHAPQFGFALETTAEKWHWHWWMGDETPPALKKKDDMQRWKLFDNDSTGTPKADEAGYLIHADGTARWIASWHTWVSLEKACGPEIHMLRPAFAALHLVGPLPNYAAGYKGPQLSDADFLPAGTP